MSKLPHGFYENYFEYGIDPINRRIVLYGEIDENSISILTMGLVLLESEDKTKKIDIMISSFGGEIYEMLSAYDVIRNMSCEIHSIAIGKIMSAAPLILAAADKARCYPSTRFMIHEGSYSIEDRMENLKITMKEYKKLERLWADRMSERTKITSKKWLNICQKGIDYYFGAEKALEYGIVDEIISS